MSETEAKKTTEEVVENTEIQDESTPVVDDSKEENDSLETEEKKKSIPSTKTFSLDSIPTNIKRSFSIFDSAINIMKSDSNNVSRDTTVLKK